VGQYVTLSYWCGVFASEPVQGAHVNPLRFELANFYRSMYAPLHQAIVNTQAAE